MPSHRRRQDPEIKRLLHETRSMHIPLRPSSLTRSISCDNVVGEHRAVSTEDDVFVGRPCLEADSYRPRWTRSGIGTAGGADRPLVIAGWTAVLCATGIALGAGTKPRDYQHHLAALMGVCLGLSIGYCTWGDKQQDRSEGGDNTICPK